MRTPLEMKKLRVELKHVEAARGELELRIEEMEDQIKRLKEHIEIQIAKEAELQQKIKEG